MCDFFLPLIFAAPDEENTVQIFNVAFYSPEMREGPHVRMTRLRMLLSRYCGFTCKFKLAPTYNRVYKFYKDF